MARYYDRVNNRLVYIERHASPNFWDDHWNVENFKKAVQANKNNRRFLNITKMFLKRGKILEGGCGIGDKVYCLHHNGYDAFGVDFAKSTVKKTKTYFPKLNILEEDVRDLKFGDAFFDGYWSMGVIEHFYEGYEAILKEMARVVKRGGYVFLKFPYMSPLRQLKARRGDYKEFRAENCNLKDFYQFILDDTTVKNDFEKHGFRLRFMKPQVGLKGLKDEVLILKPVLQRFYDYSGKFSIIIQSFRSFLSRWLARFSGHSMLMVFEKIR